MNSHGVRTIKYIEHVLFQMMGIFLTLKVSKYTSPESTLVMENILIKWTKTTPEGTKVSLCKSEFANKPE